jgi:hypothetical protein
MTEYTSRNRLDHVSTVAMTLALNSFEGITTTESCCGHKETPFWICFSAERVDCLPPVLYWFSLYPQWHVDVRTDKTKRVQFKAIGPVGAYREAMEIAEAILHQGPDWYYLVWLYIKEHHD